MRNFPTNLNHWLDYISRSHPAEIEMGLERVSKVYQNLNLDALAAKTVIVGGTNGKGSTIAMIASSLKTLGYRVASYTSPHITKYNERVVIDGHEADDASLEAAFAAVERARQSIPLTFFEFGTLAAFYCIAQQQVDVALLEVGLGGRLDAVNIIDADLAIICSVALDHTDWLGDNLDQIGYEKAGIFRHQQAVILGQDLPASVILHAQKMACNSSRFGCEFGCVGAQVFVRHLGQKQVVTMPATTLPMNNIALALQATSQLSEWLPSTHFDLAKCSASIEGLNIQGRLEQVRQSPDVYLDVAHNAHAAKHLAAFLAEQRARGLGVRAVYSSLVDKDAGAVVSELHELVDQWALAPLSVDRAMPVESLHSAVGSFAENVLLFGSIEEAIDASISATARTPFIVLIFGSFHVVEAAKAYFLAYE